ncbi:MAG TPA: DNA primase [Thermoflexia bacterium]|nr:DNA primase [Thermoflexia bacterium]
MDIVDEVKERLDIVEVVSSYLPLQKAGRNFKALCPFHTEKTPSFYVFPDSQRWHCFGACGEGGDVFSFVMRMEGWDFRTALEELAKRAGVELRPRAPEQIEREQEIQRLRDALAQAAAYFHRLLLHAPEAQAAREYVARRGLSSETAERFQLGYSLPRWEGLRDHLVEQGFTLDELEEAGLLIRREDGTTYDRFRGRLVIPIRDARGRVVGFGARTLEPDGVPKYINSPKTPLFDKSRLLFGLDLARQAIREEDRVVIVEGYMDVMRAHQEGFRNVVAQMGTALTEAQVRLLQRYTRRFVLALDPDAAGLQATLRGLEVARESLEREAEPVFDPRGLVGFEGRLGAEIRILSLPAGQDPDDLIGSDPQRWLALVEGALPVVEFVFQQLLAQADLEDAKERARIVDRMLPLLRDVRDPVEREVYAQKIARALEVDERTVLSRLHRSERDAVRIRRQPVEEPVAVRRPTSADLEGYCLAVLIRRPWLLARVNEVLVGMDLQPLQAQDFSDPIYRAVFEGWETVLAEPQPSADRLREVVPEPAGEWLGEVLSESEDLSDEQWIREGVKAALRLRQRNLKRIEADLRALTREAQEEGRPEAAEYGQACLDYARAILRIQQALARPWGEVPSPSG